LRVDKKKFKSVDMKAARTGRVLARARIKASAKGERTLGGFAHRRRAACCWPALALEF
jgi:hypothetical protein